MGLGRELGGIEYYGRGSVSPPELQRGTCKRAGAIVPHQEHHRRLARSNDLQRTMSKLAVMDERAILLQVLSEHVEGHHIAKRVTAAAGKDDEILAAVEFGAPGCGELPAGFGNAPQQRWQIVERLFESFDLRTPLPAYTAQLHRQQHG